MYDSKMIEQVKNIIINSSYPCVTLNFMIWKDEKFIIDKVLIEKTDLSMVDKISSKDGFQFFFNDDNGISWMDEHPTELRDMFASFIIKELS